VPATRAADKRSQERLTFEPEFVREFQKTQIANQYAMLRDSLEMKTIQSKPD
jgi:hypothetical protein